MFHLCGYSRGYLIPSSTLQRVGIRLGVSRRLFVGFAIAVLASGCQAPTASPEVQSGSETYRMLRPLKLLRPRRIRRLKTPSRSRTTRHQAPPQRAATKQSRTVLRSRQRLLRGRLPPTRLSRHHPQPQLRPPQVQLRQLLNRPLKPPPHSPSRQREPQRSFLRRLAMTGTRNFSLGWGSITVLLRCPTTAMTGGLAGLTPMGTA